jgi:hypothetical protein
MLGNRFASVVVSQLCYIFPSLLCDTDDENQGTVREWNV